MPSINLADAKARLSELVERAATGEHIVITKRGKPVLELSRPRLPLRKVDLRSLRTLTRQLPKQKRGAAETMRQLRDDARY
ncbi:MAG: type II toxin-antitoxin system prevent-host-death family antitoxin [Luteimonas sp.]